MKRKYIFAGIVIASALFIGVVLSSGSMVAVAALSCSDFYPGWC